MEVELERVDRRLDVGRPGDRRDLPPQDQVAGVVLRRQGSFGELPADVATPLVMVLTELMQNAVEHAFEGRPGGTVVVRATRNGKWLDVTVTDDGAGLPAGFDAGAGETLGLQIVHTLVSAELRGSIEMRPAPGGGTEAVLRMRVTRRA